ncbi:hypothetical protein [Phaeobacter sp. 11ANDIMAR09]|uniref:hypothetical protein n=1 Tax=Phaeobacter sp. 11ANDIMAR09 TaxID=1225647 RepID=UPI0006C89BC9|nr:hypothetical protein [Phaeobacter sp. 11ANDIMAR09]KPD13997.1 hypothetical protein AN476_02110 [Phaeobacter sp. 11ANDIMAR09]
MNIIKRIAASVPLIALFALTQSPNPAQAGGDAGGGGAASYGLSNATTRSVVKTLTRGGDRCSNQPPAYRCDCYRWVYRRAASQLEGNGAYSEAKEALQQVERRLEAVVAQNRDTTQPKRRRALETYTPVKPASIPRVNRAAVQAMAQAETVLLRSAANKQEHYTRIAAAVNSNKILLRSALLPGGMIRLAKTLITGFLRHA